MTVAMPPLDAGAVRQALRGVAYPGFTRDLVSFGMVRGVVVCHGAVRVDLAVRTDDPEMPARLDALVGAALRALGAAQVTVRIVAPDPAAAQAANGLSSRTPKDPWADRVRLGAVRRVVAVGAGKGGVGKSTVAAYLAPALAERNTAAGILDADIYGPSLPTLLGSEDGARRVRMTDEHQLLPLVAHGIPIMSFGFFLGERSPVVWRGPIVSKAVRQFAQGVVWPSLDVLVVDLPPGTGDVPLTLAQSIELAGAIVVTTPQRLAAAEAAKAADMFARLDVRVLGVVENMTGLFRGNGGAELAERIGAPLLGALPFDPPLSEEADAGISPLASRPDAPFAQAMRALAARVQQVLG